MTETQLSNQLGMTKAAVGYQLHLLLDTGLIKIDRTEVEMHGIQQKFYTPIAKLFFVDPDKIPKEVKRYYIHVQIEHLRGIFSAFQLYRHIPEISSKLLEKLALSMLKQLKIVGKNHSRDLTNEDAESLRVKIFAEALANLTQQKEWTLLLQN